MVGDIKKSAPIFLCIGCPQRVSLCRAKKNLWREPEGLQGKIPENASNAAGEEHEVLLR